MSSALINRSLTTVKTELEFLCDSDVITKDLYQQLVTSLPEKYHKDMAPWDVGVDKVDKEADAKDTKQDTKPQTVPQTVPQTPETALGYCKALYSFQSQQSDDLSFNKDELLCVKQHLSPDWWKGYRKNDPHTEGVFPSNYVQGISYQEYNGANSSGNEKADYGPNEKADYGPSAPYQYPTPSNSSNQSVPSYSQPDYSQFPPPSTNYYQNQNQPQPQPQQYQNQQGQTIVEHNGANQGHMRKFGGKLGNAAIFGAGATIGSDIVNSIF